MIVKIQDIIDDKKCFEIIREMRWLDGVCCTRCQSDSICKNGHHKGEKHRCQYKCKDCGKYFDDLTDTIFKGSHLPLKIWIIASYLLGLNLSASQIGVELSLNQDTAQGICAKLRKGIVQKKEVPNLEGEVEIDEVYVIAGHKGNQEAVKKKGRKPRRNRLKGKRGRGTLEDEKAPILGMIKRGGEVVLKMLPNVQLKTIKPIICKVIEEGTQIYTDEYNIYNRLTKWGYKHKTVNHGKGEYARDEDGDGFHEVHVNTMEGFCLPRNLGGSLLRSWLRPHRGISQEKLPYYLGFFEFVHNQKKRGGALLDSLLKTLLAPDKRTEKQIFDYSYI